MIKLSGFPKLLASFLVVRFLFPFEYYRTWAITLLFTSLFSLLYFTIKKVTITGIHSNAQAIDE